MEFFKKKNNKKTGFKEILAKAANIWDKSYKLIFVIFFLVLVVLGSYVWYQSLYSGEWSADKKQQYLSSQEKSINLKDREYKKALDDIDQRKNQFEQEYKPSRDIFVPYAGAPVGKP